MQLGRTQNWQWTWRLHDSFIWENAKLNRMESMAPREEKVQGKLKVSGASPYGETAAEGQRGSCSLRFDMPLERLHLHPSPQLFGDVKSSGNVRVQIFTPRPFCLRSATCRPTTRSGYPSTSNPVATSRRSAGTLAKITWAGQDEMN